MGLPYYRALCHRLLWRRFDTLRGQVFAVPRERIPACEGFSTVVTEEDFEWVRFRGVTVALEVIPC